MTHPFVFSACSRTGIRPDNQDSYAVHRGPDWILAVVADGMGGPPGGGLASRIAVDAVATCCDPDREDGGLTAGVARADTQIRSVAAELAMNGMGTTLVAVFLRADGSGAFVSIGDSVIALDGSRLAQPDNVRTALRASGVPDSELADSPDLRRLTRVLDGRGARFEVCAFRMSAGDVLQLSTDGLIQSPMEVRRSWRRWGPRAAERLTEAAERAGSRDNVTLVLVQRGSWAPSRRLGIAATLAAIFGVASFLLAYWSWAPRGPTEPVAPQATLSGPVPQTPVTIPEDHIPELVDRPRAPNAPRSRAAKASTPPVPTAVDPHPVGGPGESAAADAPSSRPTEAASGEDVGSAEDPTAPPTSPPPPQDPPDGEPAPPDPDPLPPPASRTIHFFVGALP